MEESTPMEVETEIITIDLDEEEEDEAADEDDVEEAIEDSIEAAIEDAVESDEICDGKGESKDEASAEPMVIVEVQSVTGKRVRKPYNPNDIPVSVFERWNKKK